MIFKQELRRLGNLFKKYAWILIQLYMNLEFILFPLFSRHGVSINYLLLHSTLKKNPKLQLTNWTDLDTIMICLHKRTNETIVWGFMLLWNHKISEHLNIKCTFKWYNKISHSSHILFIIALFYILLLFILHFQFMF